MGTTDCRSYREQMLLLCLKRRLQSEPLSEEEKAALRREIRRLEARTQLA